MRMSVESRVRAGSCEGLVTPGLGPGLEPGPGGTMEEWRPNLFHDDIVDGQLEMASLDSELV